MVYEHLSRQGRERCHPTFYYESKMILRVPIYLRAVTMLIFVLLYYQNSEHWTIDIKKTGIFHSRSRVTFGLAIPYAYKIPRKN